MVAEDPRTAAAHLGESSRGHLGDDSRLEQKLRDGLS